MYFSTYLIVRTFHLEYFFMKEYIQEKYRNYKHRRETSSFKMAFYDSISMIPKSQWDFSSKNIYLSHSYLESIELSHSDSVDFRYVLFSLEGKLVAKACFQLVDLKFINSISDSGSNRKKTLLKLLKKDAGVRILICGNAFANGEHGFEYLNSINKEDAFNVLATGVYRLRRSDKINGQISLVMLKDFWPESEKEVIQLKKFDYRPFEIEPNMVINLNKDWKSIDDYLKSVTSKYRNKAKSVFKKSKSLEVKNLEANELGFYHLRLDELFNNVYSKAGFKLIKFETKSFVRLKKRLGDRLVVKGYFKGDLLVGFAFSLLNDDVLDFNYVGIDYSYNKVYALYQRMMYDQISMAIQNSCLRLQLGRTATEIKSSLGAVPYGMKVLVRHRNTLNNKLIKPLVKSISVPEVDIRDPFKK